MHNDVTEQNTTPPPPRPPRKLCFRVHVELGAMAPDLREFLPSMKASDRYRAKWAMALDLRGFLALMKVSDH